MSITIWQGKIDFLQRVSVWTVPWQAGGYRFDAGNASNLRHLKVPVLSLSLNALEMKIAGVCNGTLPT